MGKTAVASDMVIIDRSRFCYCKNSSELVNTSFAEQMPCQLRSDPPLYCPHNPELLSGRAMAADSCGMRIRCVGTRRQILPNRRIP
jgi:hypothetical protein